MTQDDNKEGIKGMANPSRYGIERVAYWLMRLTGLGLLDILSVTFMKQVISYEVVGWNEFLRINSNH